MTVHLLTIEHRHGVDHWVCATEAVAYTRLDDYVQEWWGDEMNGRNLPDEPEERIKQYFDYVGDRCGRNEYYTIEQLTMQEATDETPDWCGGDSKPQETKQHGEDLAS